MVLDLDMVAEWTEEEVKKPVEEVCEQKTMQKHGSVDGERA